MKAGKAKNRERVVHGVLSKLFGEAEEKFQRDVGVSPEIFYGLLRLLKKYCFEERSPSGRPRRLSWELSLAMTLRQNKGIDTLTEMAKKSGIPLSTVCRAVERVTQILVRVPEDERS
jgi:hypothetical protein